MTPVVNALQHVRPVSTELLLAAGTIALVLATLLPGLREKRGEIFASTLLLLAAAAALLYATNIVPLLAADAAPRYLDLGNQNQALRVDKLGAFFKGLFLLIAAFTILLSYRSKEILSGHYSEFCALVLSVTLGMIFMATSADMLMIYLSVEMVSILSYVLAGFMRNSPRSAEAALKYLLYGAMASGVMIYGMSLLYGYTGTTNLAHVKAALSGQNLSGNAAVLLAVLFITAGIGYKMASVPFHFWCPDVYQGAPTPVTAFFSVGPKAAGFALAIRFFYTTLTEPYKFGGQEIFVAGLPQAQMVGGINWVSTLFLLSIATMTLGNLAALRQTSAKRLLAYSSIAHAGYLLMGLTTLSSDGILSILFYLVVYSFMNLGAFAVVMLVSDQRGTDDLSAFRGLFKEAPWIAVAMCVFLFSLTGLPPLAGFAGKLMLFGSVINQADIMEKTLPGSYVSMWTLAIVGVLNSAISLFYYARVVRAMLAGSLDDEAHEHAHGPPATQAAQVPALHIPVSYGLLVFALAAPTLVIGVSFGWLKELAEWTLTYTKG